MKKKLRALVGKHDDSHGDLLGVLEMLAVIRNAHGHSLFSADMDLQDVHNLKSLLISL